MQVNQHRPTVSSLGLPSTDFSSMSVLPLALSTLALITLCVSAGCIEERSSFTERGEDAEDATFGIERDEGVEPDTGLELDPDMRLEPEPDMEPELNPDMRLEPDPDMEPEPELDMEFELDPDMRLEPSPDMEPEPALDMEPELDPDMRLEPALDMEPEPEPDMEFEPDMELELDMELDMELPPAARPCATALTLPPPPYADPDHPGAAECDQLDPTCALSIDVLFVYTPSFLALVDNDERRVTLTAEQMVAEANLALTQSLIPTPYRYRVAGVELLAHQERGAIKSDLITLRFNPRLQALKRAAQADVVFAILGTRSYGGIAYSRSTSLDPERFIAAIDGYFLTDAHERCAEVYSTFAHEVGHLLKAGHRASQYRNPRGEAYGYHNQETHVRRNEAYGLAVDQRDLQFFTLMSYKSYSSPEGNLRGCVDCEQLHAFSSPNLWWFNEPERLGCEFAWVAHEHEGAPAPGEASGVVERVDLACQDEVQWLDTSVPGSSEPTFTPAMSELTTLTVEELIASAVPLGVDRPSYPDPAESSTIIETSFSTRNREQVIESWPAAARLEPPLTNSVACNLDCASMGRSACRAVNEGESACGPCLPDHYTLEVAGFMGGERCLPRLEVTLGDPIHDDRYEPTAVIISPGERFVSSTPIQAESLVVAVEVSLSTLNSDLEPNFSWATVGPTSWVASVAPAHTVSLFGICPRTDGSGEYERMTWFAETPDGDSGVLRDGSSQNNHALHYRFFAPPNYDCERLELEIEVENAEAGSPAYTFSIDEVRVFGQGLPEE